MEKQYPESGPLTLQVSFGNSPLTRALRSGEVSSPLLDLRFNPSSKAGDGFKPMVRNAAFDIAEIPIVTVVLAVRYGKPITIFPAALSARPQHGTLLCRADTPDLTPQALAGGNIGVTSYTRTTGVWVRGILQHEYGVSPDLVTWMCTDDPHLAEFSDPSNVRRLAGGGGAIAQALADGGVDAAILSDDAPDQSGLRPVIDNPREAALEWMHRQGISPINHVLTLDARLSRQRPDAVVELARMLVESRKRAELSEETQRMLPLGLSALRPSLDLITGYCVEQRILSRALAIDELVDPVAAGATDGL